MINICELREELHQLAEASMQEKKTKEYLMNVIRSYTALKVVDCGNWFYALYEQEENDLTIAFRADYDAVVCEDGIARHLCGHDGHSAILVGLALRLEQLHPKKNVCLIFQPGEETGEGAKICDSIIEKIGISQIYAIHNIPGFDENEIILREGTFACASTGMEIHLTGSPSHAAHPEQGKNPALVIADIIQDTYAYINEKHKGILLGTVIGVELGSRSYGVSAEKGTLRLTLRGEYQDEYDALTDWIQEMAEKLSGEQGISCKIRRIEEFPATENAHSCVENVRMAAESLGLSWVTKDEPFRWSEDFGHYLKKCEGAIFGVGCGKNHPGLHTSEYDFNDNIIETVIQMYMKLID